MLTISRKCKFVKELLPEEIRCSYKDVCLSLPMDGVAEVTVTYILSEEQVERLDKFLREDSP